MALLAPMPSASVISATAENPGDRPSRRTTCLRAVIETNTTREPGPFAGSCRRFQGLLVQKTNFNAPCRIRGSSDDRILPNVGLLIAAVGVMNPEVEVAVPFPESPLGGPRFARFGMLKPSKRNCRLLRSRIRKVRVTAALK